MLKKIFFTVAALVSLMPVFAELSFDTLAGTVQTFWSDTNGLPSNRLLDIMQDETGYIRGYCAKMYMGRCGSALMPPVCTNTVISNSTPTDYRKDCRIYPYGR